MRQFDAVLVDYVHKRKFPALGPLLTWTLRATTLAVGVGVYQFNTNDIGALSASTATRACARDERAAAFSCARCFLRD